MTNMRFIFLFLFLISCQKNDNLFELKDNSKIGISFSNNLGFDNDFNVYKYRNFYNGGGVALGDINNDGLIDLYLTSNQNKNKLYLNKGDFSFVDITDSAKVGGSKAWSTGVTMVDINSDGLVDIYVCNSGDIKGDNKQNELFINNGNLTFTESASDYNLDDKGYSTHASFFDYDKDGDLDVYILNNSYQAIGSFNLTKNERPKRDLLGGDKLMENIDGVFKDVSEKSNIFGSVIGFGLGVTVGDTNGDGWEDIFVSNDFFERDYLYINNKNGTFTEDLTNQMKSISGASMGADLADIDNDGFNDIFVTEMLPSKYERLKSVTTFEDWNKYQYVVKNGYYHQFTRNVLHLNNQNQTFSEIGRFAGVEASDWSWGALFFDMENDGYKDLFIANGIYKDLTDQDYLQYISNDEVVKSIVMNKKVDYKRLIEIIPSEKVPNHAYKNDNGINFSSFTNSGLELPSFSNGSAYGDLDNDGDLDLIVNNVNMPIFVFENINKNSNNYIKFELKGLYKNVNAIGAKITVKTKNGIQVQEVQPARGFQSTVDIRPNFGLGDAKNVDIEVDWPYGKKTFLKNIDVNQTLSLNEKDAIEFSENLTNNNNVTKPLFQKTQIKPKIIHKESNFVDFNRERLIYHMCSSEGPKMTKGDINGDNEEDILISSSKGNTTQILIKEGPNYYIDNKNEKLFNDLKDIENSEILPFDADNDGDMDLYFSSGSVEHSIYSQNLYDRLLLNNGKGEFIDSNQSLPDINNKISTAVVISGDIDNDGDLDLFVGERVKIGSYGLPCSGFILVNDGNGNFTNQTQKIAPNLIDIGMITDALFEDIDFDGNLDLILVGEYMGITIFKNEGTQLNPIKSSLSDEKGWWNKIYVTDLNNDGKNDLIVGNHGLNSRFNASKSKPLKLYYNDFDNNGFGEGIICFEAENGKDYPFALRHDLIDQIKSLKKKFPDYESFKTADITKIFDQKTLNESDIHIVNTLETSIYINKNGFEFEKIRIPSEVQFSPVYSISTYDFDNDGDEDILLGGNLYDVKPEVGIYDASYGVYLENLGNLKFKYHRGGKGFFVKGEIRDILISDKNIFVSKNNDKMEVFKF